MGIGALKIFLIGFIMQASYIDGPFITPVGIKDRPFQAQYELKNLERLSNGEISRHIKRVQPIELLPDVAEEKSMQTVKGEEK